LSKSSTMLLARSSECAMCIQVPFVCICLGIPDAGNLSKRKDPPRSRVRGFSYENHMFLFSNPNLNKAFSRCCLVSAMEGRHWPILSSKRLFWGYRATSRDPVGYFGRICSAKFANEDEESNPMRTSLLSIFYHDHGTQYFILSNVSIAYLRVSILFV
jgi:hypothetical protein